MQLVVLPELSSRSMAVQRNWNAFKCSKTRLSFICMNSLSDLGVSSNLIVRYLGVIENYSVSKQ